MISQYNWFYFLVIVLCRTIPLPEYLICTFPWKFDLISSANILDKEFSSKKIMKLQVYSLSSNLFQLYFIFYAALTYVVLNITGP